MQTLDTYNNTNGTRGHVPHNAGTAVVELVWHAFVDGTVTAEINVISQFKGGQVALQIDLAMRLEVLGEQLPRAGPQTVRVRHGSAKKMADEKDENQQGRPQRATAKAPRDELP